MALASYGVLADGIARAQADERRVRFITLTDTAAGAGTVQSFYASWQRLALRLNRRGLLGEYARVLEVTKRGNLHIHALMADAERGGGFIPQRQLSELAAASGFGKVADIRAVGAIGEPCDHIADYFTKGQLHSETMELVGYCGKQTAERLAELGAERTRPLSVSRTWPGGGIRAAEAELMKHWYGKDEAGTFEVWNQAELEIPLRLLRQHSLAAASIREARAAAALLADVA